MKFKIHKWKVRGETKFVVDLRAANRGKHFFESDEKAREFLTAEKLEVEAHGSVIISAADRAMWTLSKAKADACGKTVLELCELGAQLSTPAKTITLVKSRDEYSMALKNSGKSKGYIEKMQCLIRSMERHFNSEKNVHELGRKQIEEFLLTKETLSTRKYCLQDCRTFFQFAKGAGWCRLNPCDDISDIELGEFSKGILTPEQLKVFLETAKANDKRLMRYFADQAFGGLREDESSRLRKNQVHPTYIHLDKTKIGMERFNEFNETWTRWRLKGDYAPVRNLRKRAEKIRELAKAEMLKRKLVKSDWWFPANCLRHSFCTYFAPVIGAEKTARLAGHSEKTQKQHYRRPVPLEVAKKYLAL